MAILDKFKPRNYDEIPTNSGNLVQKAYGLVNPRSDALNADTLESQAEVESSVAGANETVKGMKDANIAAVGRQSEIDSELKGVQERSRNWSKKPSFPFTPAKPQLGGMALPAPKPGPMAPMRPIPPAANANIGMSGPLPGMPKRPSAVAVATSPAARSATASLAKPMDQVRSEAYGGPGFQGPMAAKAPTSSAPGGLLPPPATAASPTAPSFGAPRPLLGNTTFKNLQPRRSGNPMDSGGATQSSYAGFAPYLDEQTAGAPRRLSGLPGRRSGARFTEGPMRGKTLDQAAIKSREQYAALSPEQKAAYEAKAAMKDISSEVPAPPAEPTAPAPSATLPPPVSIDPAEMAPMAPRRKMPLLDKVAQAGRRDPSEDWPD